MRIRAVLFDAGATLLYPNPPVEAVYAREFSRDGASFSEDSLARALTRAWEEVHAGTASDRYGGVRGEPEFWQTFLNRVRGELDGRSVSAESFRRLAEHFRDPFSWMLYDDVLDTLDRLGQEGLLLAVVSNWDSHLPKLLRGLGISERFRALAVSGLEGVGKPDAEIFQRTCKRLGVETADALHVGDSLREDYEGAIAAGLSAILLDRRDEHPEISERIRRLSELPERLRSMPP